MEKRLIDANDMKVLGELPYNYEPVRDGDAWYRADDVWDCIEKEPTVEVVADKAECADMDYKAHYDKQREEIACLKMKLMDSEERCRMLREDVTKLSTIKATVEVIFGRKFDG